jgi:ferrous iron transport protein B
MARAVFLLDRILGVVGLSGRSFVPLMTSFGCAVPAVLSTRIIDNERDRLATIAILPLMSCSARLPVYVLLIGAFFPPKWAGLVLFSLYALGIVVAAAVALLLRRTVLRGEGSLLMMELPEYQSPSMRVLLYQVGAGLREFFTLAGTVILATSVIIWLFSYYPRPTAIHAEYETRRASATQSAQQDVQDINGQEEAAYLAQSYLARLGRGIQPIFAPAGFDWRTTIGILAAFSARENIIPTLGILYSVGEVEADRYDRAWLRDGSAQNGDALRDRLRSSLDENGRRAITGLSALSLMVFFALCSQCIGTLATIRRETRSWRWPVFIFAYMTGLAWLFAVLVYQFGRMLGYA